MRYISLSIQHSTSFIHRHNEFTFKNTQKGQKAAKRWRNQIANRSFLMQPQSDWKLHVLKWMIVRYSIHYKHFDRICVFKYFSVVQVVHSVSLGGSLRIPYTAHGSIHYNDSLSGSSFPHLAVLPKYTRNRIGPAIFIYKWFQSGPLFHTFSTEMIAWNNFKTDSNRRSAHEIYLLQINRAIEKFGARNCVAFVSTQPCFFLTSSANKCIFNFKQIFSVCVGRFNIDDFYCDFRRLIQTIAWNDTTVNCVTFLLYQNVWKCCSIVV